MLSLIPTFGSLSILLTLLLPHQVSSAINPLIQIADTFGPNPTNVSFYIYLPPTLQSSPPILVNPHWCQGTASAAFGGTNLASLADTHGYIMIFPSSPHSGGCWDLSSKETLHHDAGGDSLGIVSMVRWTIQKHGADASRVFAMGTSSGAMMTNVLLGAYPDVFAAGSAWAGVPFGCYADPAGGTAVWNDDCAKGRVVKTGAEWKAIVQAAYPGYQGWRPKMQVFHGTVDNVVYPQNFQEEIKQWTGVLGLSSEPMSVRKNDVKSGWTTYRYGGGFEATSAEGVGHDIQTNSTEVLRWFDLACRGQGCFSRPREGGGGTTSKVLETTTMRTSSRSSSNVLTTVATSKSLISTLISTTAVATASPTSTLQVKYGQCGGLWWTGPTACVSGSICTITNTWYSQCV
ncbi:related to acetylxylan esterase [Rhynchosporium agropyri]|uniref:Carboxylic ester hydrolase n=1 Tax=Rhynchosporium agropyri TaxID=914238 RepID=A0A1E1LIZ7_9HELO|nr:related to acetylxylan esterase [Rhynchosporium agropyri]